jgi:hypothetical protein
MNHDENKYNDLIKTLKSLQKVKAHPNFETDLKRRLNVEKYEKKERRGLKNIFIPSRLIPSFGLAVAAVIMFLLINVNSEEADNPFLTEPKVREDIILVSDTDEILIPEKSENEKNEMVEKEKMADKKDDEMRREMMTGEGEPDENLIAGREFTPPESTLTIEPEIASTGEVSAPPATGFAIRKSGLNFRQINPTKKEQEEILNLKKKVQTTSKKIDIE